MPIDPWLIILGIDPSLWSYPIVEGRQILGRGPKSDIRVIHPHISRLHAEIDRRGDRMTIRDLRSRNGLLVNNLPTAQAPLSLGDRLGLADLVLRVVEADQLSTLEHDDPLSTACDEEASESPESFGFVDARLTAAEAKVLSMLLLGLSEKQVAARLFNSPHTVHTHVKRIYQALGVHSRAELLSRCLARLDEEVVRDELDQVDNKFKAHSLQRSKPRKGAGNATRPRVY